MNSFPSNVSFCFRHMYILPCLAVALKGDAEPLIAVPNTVLIAQPEHNSAVLSHKGPWYCDGGLYALTNAILLARVSG